MFIARSRNILCDFDRRTQCSPYIRKWPYVQSIWGRWTGGLEGMVSIMADEDHIVTEMGPVTASGVLGMHRLG